MTKSNHVHRFKRHAYKTGNKVFFCTLENCHFKIEVSLSLGKTNICNRCEKPFKMNELSIRMAKPHCNDCIVRKGATRADTMARKETSRAIAADEVSSLRERLSNVSVIEYTPEGEKDDL